MSYIMHIFVKIKTFYMITEEQYSAAKSIVKQYESEQFDISANITNLSAGQTVWYRLTSDRRGDDTSLKETKILSVGKKYIEVEEKNLGKFFKSTLKQDAGKYTSKYQIYLSKEQYDNEVEANKIYSELRNIFSGYGKTNMELSKLRAILTIIRS